LKGKYLEEYMVLNMNMRNGELGRTENCKRKYSKMDKGQRISWLGHLERMEENRMPKMIFSQELEGPRRRGRPRKRWKEEVERDLHVLGVSRWRELATNRKKWRDIGSTGQSPQRAVVPMEGKYLFPYLGETLRSASPVQVQGIKLAISEPKE
jgi:hypothetical protein